MKNSEIKETFSERLKTLIEEQRITQKELAEKAGVTQATISHYMQLKRNPNVSVVIKLASALNTSVDYLLRGEYYSGTPCSDSAFEEIMSLVRKNNPKLSKDQKIKLLSFLID